MATDEISGVRSSGTPSRSAASRRIAGISRPLVTTTQAGLSVKNASTEARAASSDSVSRYEISVAPSTCTRSGCTWRTNPASASPGFWMRWIVMRRPRPDSPGQQHQAKLGAFVQQRPDRERRRHGAT